MIYAETEALAGRRKPKRFFVNRAARRAAGFYTRRFKTDRRAPKAIRHPLAGLPVKPWRRLIPDGFETVRRSGATER